jgi:hypothetical protein
MDFGEHDGLAFFPENEAMQSPRGSGEARFARANPARKSPSGVSRRRGLGDLLKILLFQPDSSDTRARDDESDEDSPGRRDAMEDLKITTHPE